MVEDFDIVLQLKNDLKKRLIFGLDARLPIAKILGFSGYRHEILPQMQTLSNSTRAFLVNANGLPAFVFKISIIRVLR